MVLTVFPHCDMHLALNTPGANKIDFRVFEYIAGALPDTFDFSDETGGCTVRILAPHNPVGTRLEQFVTVDVAAKTITATKTGTNLIVFQTADNYAVVRVQVHDKILAWWFGNATVTTPLDALRAHSQPSLYAAFSDDPTGTDRVGDITGHGFVTLTSKKPATFTVDNANHAGRLMGLVETGDPSDAELEGDFLGIKQGIKINVVDYAKPHDLLVPIRITDLAKTADIPNILFLAEGFTAAEEEKFNQLVRQALDELFSKPRHEPYATLAASFNVFAAFTPSREQLTTCAFQVAEDAVDSLKKGTPIPETRSVSDDTTKNIYTVVQLVERVGLPKRGENRTLNQLKSAWAGQNLPDFDGDRIDEAVVSAWKNSHAASFLEARDTFFGMRLGAHWRDTATWQDAPISNPAADDGSADLRALVRRAYKFYENRDVPLTVDMDPRRHPPKVFLSGHSSLNSSVMTFIAGLRLKDAPHQAIGGVWMPDGTYKPSVGLVAIILNDHLIGGTNIGALTGSSPGSDRVVQTELKANANANIKRLVRTVPVPMDHDLTETVDTIAHEFGHSFRLDDEYERFDEPKDFAKDFLDPNDARPNRFETYDNVTSMEAIFDDPTYIASDSRTIDPEKIKWGKLPRIKISARLAAAPVMAGGKLEAIVDPREADLWEAARLAGEEAHLRRILIEPTGQQLPLSTLDANHLTGLIIDSVDKVTGKIVLSSATPLGAPNFPAGSMLFVPHRANGVVLGLIEPKVLAFMKGPGSGAHQPLNKDKEAKFANKGADFPVEIPGFEAPCRSARLIGAYEGAGTFSGLVYRATGTCKMRTSGGTEENGEFCHVCKWLITNRVDPGKHAEIDRRFYPKAKKNG